ncbi:hypothetical protein [Thalassobaculum sp.]|uniref:hypothetical protein n=1 Tax=Thalassobaculum sp. TaxID=2022740 RepID=UPI0032EF0E8F
MILTILRRALVCLFAAVVVLSTPVLGLMGLGAWQQYDPGSFRAAIYQISALTEVEDADQMYGNLVALFDTRFPEQRG